MSRDEREIPEEVFRKDFGGNRFEAQRIERFEGSQRRLVLGGLLALLTAPAIASAVGAAIAAVYFCRWGYGCF